MTDSQIHWFSITNSIMIVLFLSGKPLLPFACHLPLSVLRRMSFAAVRRAGCDEPCVRARTHTLENDELLVIPRSANRRAREGSFLGSHYANLITLKLLACFPLRIIHMPRRFSWF
jgi:hypothetical protein